jgi:hypothetical protein
VASSQTPPAKHLPSWSRGSATPAASSSVSQTHGPPSPIPAFHVASHKIICLIGQLGEFLLGKSSELQRNLQRTTKASPFATCSTISGRAGIIISHAARFTVASGRIRDNSLCSPCVNSSSGRTAIGVAGGQDTQRFALFPPQADCQLQYAVSRWGPRLCPAGFSRATRTCTAQ